MEEVGQEAFRHNTSLYYLKLTDNLEKPYNLKPIGIDHIASTSCRVNLTYSPTTHLAPWTGQGATWTSHITNSALKN